MKKISGLLITAFVFLLGLVGIASSETAGKNLAIKGVATDQGKQKNFQWGTQGKEMNLDDQSRMKSDNLGSNPNLKLDDLDRSQR